MLSKVNRASCPVFIFNIALGFKSSQKIAFELNIKIATGNLCTACIGYF